MTDTMTFAPPQDTDVAPPSDGRNKLIAGGVAGVLVLAAGGYLLLGRGGSEPVAAPIVKGHAKTSVVPGAKVSKPVKAAIKPTTTLPVASTARLGRDPFKPLVTPPVEAAAGAGTGTTPAATTPTTTDGSTGTTPTSSKATAPYTLKLSSISSTQPGARIYTFSYATTTKRVIAGQKFGKYGELVVLAVVLDSHNKPVGALIQVGDADPKSMATGSKATVA